MNLQTVDFTFCRNLINKSGLKTVIQICFHTHELESIKRYTKYTYCHCLVNHLLMELFQPQLLINTRRNVLKNVRILHKRRMVY